MQLLKDQPKRMAQELRQLEEHAKKNSGFTMQTWDKTAAGELCLDFRLQLLAGFFEGRLVYPQLFPDVPAFIQPQRAGECWSSHQYLGSGVLCLEYGPDNWHPSITGVNLVRSANNLLWQERLTALIPGVGAVPSRHSSTLGQNLRGSPRRLSATSGFRESLAAGATGAALRLKANLAFLNGVEVLTPIAIGAPPVPLADVPLCLGSGRGECQGWAVPVSSAKAIGAPATVEAVKAALGPAWPWSEALGDALSVLVLHDPQGDLRSFLVTGGTDTFCFEYTPLPVDREPRLPGGFSVLADATVAIVGLGSIGSKMAVSMARAGVRRFLLVDDDVLAVHNLVRNELNWLDVGFSKVDAVAQELKRISAGIDVRVQTVRVAGQENPLLAAKLGDELGKCSLIVDATASPSAFVMLAAIARRASVPMVWGHVFGGGTGGLMARSRPALDPSALDVHTHIRGVLGTLAPIPEGAAHNYGIELEGRVYVASDADVAAMAASMTQFSLDVLCAPAESNYPFAAYLVGFRKYWVFSGPFDTIPIDCSAAMQVASEVEPLTADESERLAELVGAIEERDDAANNGSP